jgi:hypothetical protein
LDALTRLGDCKQFGKMPLTPEEDALCHQLEEVESELHRSAAVVIRRMAGEIDALWDRVNHLHRVIRGDYGDASSVAEEMQQLQRRAGE